MQQNRVLNFWVEFKKMFLEKMSDLKQTSILDIIILGLVFFIPLAWSKQVNANYVSVKTFLFYFVAGLSLFSSFKKIVIPNFSNILKTCLVLLCVLQIFSLVLNPSFLETLFLFKFFSFAILSYYFLSLKIDLESVIRKSSFVIFFVSLLIVIFAFWDFYKFRIEDLNVQSGYILGSFGNVNMLAEFLILTLPLLFAWNSSNRLLPLFCQSRRFLFFVKGVKFLILIGWLFFILYCRSRSAWIGLGLWLAYRLYKKSFRKEFLALGVAFVLYQIAIFAPADTNGTILSKQTSFAERLSLYQATVELIKDNPLGIGVGQFVNEIVPYQMQADVKPSEYMFYDQPHSEILKWGAQYGWLGLVIIFILFYLIINKIYFSNSTKPNDKQKTQTLFLAESFLVLVPQMLFQFPFENPASLLYLSFVFALFVGLFSVQREIKTNLLSKMLFGIIGLVMIVHSIAYISSIYLESVNPESLPNLEKSCEIYPINMNGCFLKDFLLLKNGNYAKAKTELYQDLQKYPLHGGYMRLLPTTQKNIGHDRQACEGVLMYKKVFPEQKFFEEKTVNACGQFKLLVDFKNPSQFKADYVNWLAELFR